MLSEPLPSAPEALLTSCFQRAFCVHKDTHGVEGKARLPELDRIYSPFVLTPAGPGSIQGLGTAAADRSGDGVPGVGCPALHLPRHRILPGGLPWRIPNASPRWLGRTGGRPAVRTVFLNLGSTCALLEFLNSVLSVLTAVYVELTGAYVGISGALRARVCRQSHPHRAHLATMGNPTPRGSQTGACTRHGATISPDPAAESSSPQAEKPCSGEGKSYIPLTCKPGIQHVGGSYRVWC